MSWSALLQTAVLARVDAKQSLISWQPYHLSTLGGEYIRSYERCEYRHTTLIFVC